MKSLPEQLCAANQALRHMVVLLEHTSFVNGDFRLSSESVNAWSREHSAAITSAMGARLAANSNDPEAAA